MRLPLKTFIRISKSGVRSIGSWANNRDLFEYTSGRFLFNEELRRVERQVYFNVDALASVICCSVSQPVSELASIVKLAEGGFNRVLQATFNNGYEVIARIPYHIMVPKHRAIASEAATLGLLRSRGVPVPKVLGYCAYDTNPVGTEYLLLEKLDGTALGDKWFTMDNKARVKIMRQIVDVEKQFMSISLPASGSLYYRKDLEASEFAVPLLEQSTLDEIVVGPTAQFAWWYQERALLNVDRGPCASSLLMPMNLVDERTREDISDMPRSSCKTEMSPIVHIQILSKYLILAPDLEISSEHPFSRPVLRHPDFSPNNILINSSNEIVGVIDWQHSVILPLCLCSGIPHHFQNWGDPLSERLAKPEVRLPDGFDNLSRSEQEAVQETMRRRLVHFYYAALTMRQMPDHFDALRNENAMLRAKLFDRAGAPWEGESLSLKHTMLQAYQNWPMDLENVAPTHTIDCPVTFSEEEIRQCIGEHIEEQEKLQELKEMRSCVGVDSLGWVPDDEQLEKSREVVQAIKAGLLEHSTTEIERVALQNHFPFDDYDEDI
ncbi:hypothetical protein PRK78_004748 [Emydomyces testavorans]|uniref:Aminoglycoside phosphotransferase domain-containing protein n=1 Tax=Emydomyces testavorans TaxID=2070801 RepID=A0AAF0ILZ6_9EURO|nr:hypothetical protein PRK78_004748 [Emydomyces testavorans]